MNFSDYRNDALPLEEMVRVRLSKTGVAPEDVDAVFVFLAPLGAKHEAGTFHRNHSLRVGLLASEIAAHLKLDERALLLAGLLHDVGKALVPYCTLSATEKWTAEDQRVMEQHVTDSFRLLRDRFDFTAHVVVLHHAFQAHAYPKEMPEPLHAFSTETQAKIVQYGHILALADVFDAMHRVNSASKGGTDIHLKMLGAFPDDHDLITDLYDKGVLR